MALDIRSRVALGQARRLRLGECVLVGLPSFIRERMKLAVALSRPRSAIGIRSRETVDQRTKQRSAGHDGRLSAKRNPAAARQARELHAAQGHGPLV